MRRINKKGVSPVIATTLLILLVVILAVIIFMWAKSFVEEAVEKDSKPAEQVCGEVNLEFYYDGTDLQVTNIGNVPVYQFEIKSVGGGTITTPENKGVMVNVGHSETFGINLASEATHFEIYPVILGEAGDSNKLYTCLNHGHDVYAD